MIEEHWEFGKAMDNWFSFTLRFAPGRVFDALASNGSRTSDKRNLALSSE